VEQTICGRRSDAILRVRQKDSSQTVTLELLGWFSNYKVMLISSKTYGHGIVTLVQAMNGFFCCGFRVKKFLK